MWRWVSRMSIRARSGGSCVAEPADAGPGVEHQHRAVVAAHLDARRVAAVARGLRPGRRDRAAGAEQGDAHGHSISQNSAAAPRNSRLSPTIGIAATSICRRTPFMPLMKKRL